MRSASFKSIPARSPGVRSNQLSKASCAAATARSTSSVPPTGTSARTSSVAGLEIFSVFPSAAAVASPPMNNWNFFMASSPLLVGNQAWHLSDDLLTAFCRKALKEEKLQ